MCLMRSISSMSEKAALDSACPMPGCRVPSLSVGSGCSSMRWSMLFDRAVKPYRVLPCLITWCVLLGPAAAFAVVGDEATHESDHEEDVLELPEVHVHGLSLNKDQQLGPVAKSTTWPAIPAALEGQELDDWMKARVL